MGKLGGNKGGGKKKKKSNSLGSILGGVVKGGGQKTLPRGSVNVVKLAKGSGSSSSKGSKHVTQVKTLKPYDREYEAVLSRAAAAAAASTRRQREDQQRPTSIVFAPPTFVMHDSTPHDAGNSYVSAIDSMVAEVTDDSATIHQTANIQVHENTEQLEFSTACEGASVGVPVKTNRFNLFSGDDDDATAPTPIQFAPAAFQLPKTFTSSVAEKTPVLPFASFHSKFGVGGIVGRASPEGAASCAGSNSTPLILGIQTATVFDGQRACTEQQALPGSDDEL